MAKVLLGITGGIAAYKGSSICSGLQKIGHDVRVVMTQTAEKMVTPHTLASLSHHIVYVDKYWMENTGRIDHIDLAEWLDILLIAPATANTIGKISNGIADNLLCALAMATPHTKLRIMAPAMNTVMWDSGPVSDNLSRLELFGWKVITPSTGKMACGTTGIGILPKTREILAEMDIFFNKTEGDDNVYA